MIYLVEPTSGACVSGGFRFNEQIRSRLRRDGVGRSLEITEMDNVALASTDVVVVDSLYLSSEVPEWVDRFSGTLCFLLHFLPSRQGHLSGSARHRLVLQERVWFSHVERVLVPDERFAACLPEGLDVRVAPPGVAPCFRRALPPRKSDDGGALRVVSVNALTPSKNPIAVARALAELSASAISWDIVGDQNRDASYRRRLLAELECSGLSSSVRFKSGLSSKQVARLLDRAQLYVTASLEESYGMATAEAVARGLPVLSLDVGCASRWIQNGVNGHVFASDAEAELGRTLVKLARDRARLARLMDGAVKASRASSFATWEESYQLVRRGIDSPETRMPERRRTPRFVVEGRVPVVVYREPASDPE
jgi:glycosyltransferase involved in cell wall biosynthesis